MRQIRQRKCLACGTLFQPDYRVGQKHRYCSSPPCRQASHRASQARWFQKPENRKYFRGSLHVDRVRKWQKAHPDWRRRRQKRPSGLHDMRLLQRIPVQDDTRDEGVGLHDLMLSQPPVVVGLVACLTGSGVGLHDEIEQTLRKMHVHGQAILGIKHGVQPKGTVRHDGSKTCVMSQADAASSAAVQLG